MTTLPVYADESLRNSVAMTTGANEDGFHFRNVSMERDITVTRWSDLRVVIAGGTPAIAVAHRLQTAPLVMSYADTAAFAVSVEPASAPPSQPTNVIAIGNTSA